MWLFLLFNAISTSFFRKNIDQKEKINSAAPPAVHVFILLGSGEDRLNYVAKVIRAA